MIQRLAVLTSRHPAATTWSVALVVRAAYVVVVGPDPLAMVDSAEYDGMARDLLAGRGLTTAVGFVRPPIYPLFVAGSYAVGGIAALQVAQIVLGATTAWLILLLARELYAPRPIGPTTGLIAAVYPWFIPFVGGLASETVFTFFATAAFLMVLRAARRGSLRSILTSGVALGIAALTRANVLTCAACLAIWLLASRQGVRAAGSLVAGVVLALLPFTIYQLAQGNGLVLTSSGGGFNFYVGNNPDAAMYYSDRIPTDEWRYRNAHLLGPAGLAFAGCPPNVLQVQCADLLPADQREAFWYRAGMRYIASAPAEWLGLEVHKLAAYWRPWVDSRELGIVAVIVSGASFGSVLALALIGCRLMPRWSMLFVLAIAAGSTLAAVGWYAFLRWRFVSLDPVLIAAAGPAVELIAAPWIRTLGAVLPRRGRP